MLQGVKTCSSDRWNVACTLLMKDCIITVSQYSCWSQNSSMVMSVGFPFLKKQSYFIRKCRLSPQDALYGLLLGFKTLNTAIKLIFFSGKKIVWKRSAEETFSYKTDDWIIYLVSFIFSLTIVKCILSR
jgi:hypothetical protein